MLSNKQFCWGSAILLCVFTLFLTGCGGSGRLPVSGEIKLDGEVVDKGGIGFIPLSDAGGFGKISGRIIDGRYEIVEEKGPAPGKYKVIIFWEKKTGRTYFDDETGEEGEVGEEFEEREEGMPEIYRDQDLTPLTVEFVKGQEVYDIVITSSE